MAQFEQTKALLEQEGIARARPGSLYPVDNAWGNFEEEDVMAKVFDRDHGFFDSAGAGFMRTGIVVGGIELGAEAITKPDFAVDPTFDLVTSYETDSDLKGRMDPYMADGVTNAGLLEQIARAGSNEEINYILDLADQNEERRKIAQNNFGGELVGTIGSVGIDILAILGLAATTRGLGMAGVADVIPLIRGVQGSRAVAAGRGIAFGAGDAAVEGLIQQAGDHTISNRDIMFSMAMGGLIGGTIGGAFPRAFNVDVGPGLTPEAIDALVKGKKAAKKASLSAASVDDPALKSTARSETTSGVPDPSAGSVLAGKITDHLPGGKFVAKMALRSPKRIIVDMGVRGLDQLNKLGRNGNLQFYKAANRLLQFTTAHSDEIAGTAVRDVNAQQILDGFFAASAAVSKQAELHFKKALQEIFPGIARVKIALAASNVGRTKSGSYAANRFFAGLDIPAFERMSDKLRKMDHMIKRAQADGKPYSGELDARAIMGDEVFDQLTEEQVETLMGALRKAGNDQETFYQRMGEREVELGVIQAEELIPGYTPQIWNQDALKVNKEAFIAWMTRVFRQEVEEYWVQQNFKEVLDDAGKVQAAGLRDGETLEAFAKRDPEAFNAIQQLWEEALGDAEAHAVRGQLDKADEAVAAAERATSSGILERLDKNLAKDRTQLLELEAMLAKTKRGKKKGAGAVAVTIAEKIVKVERRIANKESRISAINEAEFGLESMQKALKPVVKGSTKSKLSRLYRLQNRAEAKALRHSAKKYASEQIEELHTKISGGEPYFGVVPDDFKVTSSRFKRRSINLGQHELDEEADMFLYRDQQQLRESFSRGVGSQLAIRQMFNMTGPGFDRSALRKEFLSGFEDDLAMLKTGSKEHKVASKEMREAEEMADFILDDFLGTFAFKQGLADRAAATAMTATSAIVLGKVLLSSITDMAVTAFAGGRFMTGYRSFLRRNGKAFKEMHEEGLDSSELAIILEGLSTVNGRRFDNLADIERHDFDIPGSTWSKIRRTVDDVATLEGWASLMHVWNSHIRGSFGVDWANSIFKDVHAGWDTMNPSIKMFYSRLGIGSKEFEMLKANYAKGTKKYAKGRLTMPDLKTWDADAYSLFKRALKAAGDEAMLDPSIADRPFLKRNALGRLIIQFQSFTFTAGERYVAPMMQSMRLHPGEARQYWSLFIALGLAGINDGIRSHMQGKGQEWRDGWTTKQGSYDNMTALFLRSPLAAGGTSWAYESVGQLAGASINEVAEDTVGFRPIREVTKWQQNQGMLGILGPAVGLTNTVRQAALSGDSEAHLRLLNRVPILNTIIPQFAMAAAFDKLDQ